VSLFREEGRSFYRREREHEARGSGARARPVPAGREEGAALAGAAGCGVLWHAAGAMGGAEMVWFRGGHGRGPV
jgi:hypothetical protein